MTRSDPQVPTAVHRCAVCLEHDLEAPDRPVRLGPLRLAAGLVRAAVAVGAVAIAARATPDPIDLRPRVLQDS